MTLPLHLWDLPPDATARLINVSENRTYLIEAGALRWVLRVHRPGYQRRAAIESELAWMAALRDVMAVPEPVAGRDGAMLQGSDPVMVLFGFIPGAAPPDDAPPSVFETLGDMAARLHGHARNWSRPEGFERPAWDLAAVFGPMAHWGDWRAAPGVDAGIQTVLEEAEAKVRFELAAFGTAPDRYGLIHADMRAANLLVDGRDIRLIDFDDCGFGWFLYDFAAAVSFIETRPDLGALKAAWLRGYRRQADLPEADAAMLDSFVMLRRLALLAWIGSHAEAPEPQAMAPHFASGTAGLARRYLASDLF